MSATPQHNPAPSRLLVLLLALLLAAAHAALTEHFVPLHAVLSHAPIQGDDFDLHIGQTFRVLEGLRGWGKSWVYDVRLLAGQPEGTIFDADNKGCEIFTFALSQLGVDPAVAFNLFIWLSTALAPLLVFAAARLFGFAPWSSVLAAGLGSAIWFFDSFAHWVWFVGMVSYGLASYLALLPLAFLYRFTERRRLLDAAACGLLLGATHVVHPYTFFMLALPMGALYARAFRQMRGRDHAAISGIAAITLAMNAYWLRAAFAHWHYVLDSAYYGQTGLSYLVADFFALLRDPSDTGVIGTRTGIRLLCVGLGLAGVAALRRAQDRRALALGSALVAMLALAYLGAYVPGARQIQPYRHVLPAAYFATLGCAAFAERFRLESSWSAWPRSLRALSVVAALLVLQHLGIEAIYYLPEFGRETPPLADNTPSPINKYGYIEAFLGRSHVSYVLPHPSWLEGYAEEVVRFIAANAAPGERVLVDNAVIGERIAWKTRAEVLGGFRERNIAHAYANFFRLYGDRMVDAKTLERYLRTFAVRYVVLQRPRADFAAASSLLEPLGVVAGRLIYRTRVPVSKVLQGEGTVTGATNRLEVRGSDPGRAVVLAYHHHEFLRCSPGCRVDREPNGLDAVGFVRIPAPHPRDFVVANAYR